jgi:hypothetical protein
MTVSGAQFRLIEQSATHSIRHRSIALPPPMDEQAEQDARQEQEVVKTETDLDIDLLELEAEALIIKLKLHRQRRTAA